MEFRNPEERREAEIAIVLYLPQMVRLYEKGLEQLGAKVEIHQIPYRRIAE